MAGRHGITASSIVLAGRNGHTCLARYGEHYVICFVERCSPDYIVGDTRCKNCPYYAIK